MLFSRLITCQKFVSQHGKKKNAGKEQDPNRYCTASQRMRRRSTSRHSRGRSGKSKKVHLVELHRICFICECVSPDAGLAVELSFET
eukprot:g49153.t1